MKITALKTWQVPPRWLFLKIETDVGVYGWGEPVVDKSALKIDDGFIAIPQGPGLGVEIDEAYVEERSKVGHRWRNPVWTHEDGSIAEW